MILINVTMKFASLLLLALSLFASFSPAQAAESMFGYTYTTDTLPKGKFELEQWITDKESQAQGWYHHFDMSTEIEYGVTDNFQIALYVNYHYLNASGNSVRGLTEGMEIPYDHNPGNPYSALSFDGASMEFLYRFFSPYTDAVGFAVYAEPEIGISEQGLELRAIVQKNLWDDQLILAFNAWIEFDRERDSNLGADPGDAFVPVENWSNATYAEFDLGASYRVAASNWYVGLEFRNHNEFGGYDLSRADQDHTAFFIGPNVHYANEHFFATLTILRQIGAFGYNEDQTSQIQNGLLYGDEHTAWDGIRLKIGFPFN